MGILSWAFEFVGRHKGKVLAVGLLTGGALVAWRSADGDGRLAAMLSTLQSSLTSSLERAAMQQVSHQRRRATAYAASAAECEAAVNQFVPFLQKRLHAITDMAPILAQLRKQVAAAAATAGGEPKAAAAAAAAPSKDALWHQLLVTAVTRLVVGAYLVAGVVATLRLHMTLHEKALVMRTERARAVAAEASAEAAGSDAAGRDAGAASSPATLAGGSGSASGSASGSGSGGDASPAVEAAGGESVRARADAEDAEAVCRALIAVCMQYVSGPGLAALVARTKKSVETVTAGWSVREMTVASPRAASEDVVARVLDGAWDVLESPNFQAALRGTNAAVFAALRSQLRASVFAGRDAALPLARVVPKLGPLTTAASKTSCATAMACEPLGALCRDVFDVGFGL